jgi:hypothetical protein
LRICLKQLFARSDCLRVWAVYAVCGNFGDRRPRVCLRVLVTTGRVKSQGRAHLHRLRAGEVDVRSLARIRPPIEFPNWCDA